MNGPLAANLGVLSARFPELAAKLGAAAGGSSRIAPGDKPVLEVKCGEAWIRLHSRYDPAGEASRMLDAACGTDSRFVVLLGLGAGHGLEEALRRLPPDAQVAAIEHDAELFRRALEMRDISPALSDKRLILIVGESPSGVARKLDRYTWGLSFRGPCIVEHPAYAQLDLPYMRDMRKRILELFEIEKTGVATRLAGQKDFTRNIMRNLPRLAAAPGIAELFGMFKNKPAVLVAAGPSLNKQLPALKELQGRAVIICVDTAMRAVLNAGIRPDLVVAVDFTPVNYRHFDGVDTSGLTVAAASIVYPRCLEVHKGPLFAIFNDYPIVDWMMPMLGSRGHVVIGDSTAHTAFHIAEKLCCDPIILIGQDLAYTGGKTHAEGVATRKDAGRKDGLSVDGWDGGKVETSSALMTMLKHFEQKISECRAKVINATEGGARIEGAEHLSFRDAMKLHCLSEFNAAGAIKLAEGRLPSPDYEVFREDALLARRRAVRVRRLTHQGMRCIKSLITALCENRVEDMRKDVARLDGIYDRILMDGELLHILQGGVELALMQLRWPDSSAGIPLKHDFLTEIAKDRRFLTDMCVATADFSKELKVCLTVMPEHGSHASRQTDEWIRLASELACWGEKK